MTETICIAAIALCALISILSYKERRELTTKVMCRDAREYEEIIHPKETHQMEKSPHQKAVDAFHRKGIDALRKGLDN